MNAQRFLAALAGLAVVFTLAACRTSKPLPEQRFDLRGKVIAVDAKAGTVTLAHDAIPGYMAAMTMDYPVKDKWAFDVLKPGQTVQATLVVASDQAWIEGIGIGEQSKPSAAPGGAGSPLGREVPDFALVNQDGKRIHLGQYRGKKLLVTFIYTRCPLPNYCPLMSKNFERILSDVRANQALAASTHLLSISIDPAYDTPAVLREYGVRYVGNPPAFAEWEFASGSPEQVRKVAEFFGLKYWTEGGQIVHALVTALVGPDGKVVQIYSGNDWLPQQVVSELESSRQP